MIGFGPSEISAQVLGDAGISTTLNTMKWLHRVEVMSGGSLPPGHPWAFRRGDLVVVDEAAMVSTDHLERIHNHARAAGAKLLLLGDPAQRLYARMVDPLIWTPYPDTGKVLEALSGSGIHVAVVSNIPFDIRPAFRAHDWDRYVEVYALSFELGAIKPDRPIFERTLELLGVAPEETLMVGDSRENDGAATELGCAFEWVNPLPTADRRTGLLDALARRGVL